MRARFASRESPSDDIHGHLLATGFRLLDVSNEQVGSLQNQTAWVYGWVYAV